MTASPGCCGFPQPQLLTSWLAAAVAVAAAILLWGVGVEAMCFGHRLSGGFLLTDAIIVTALEAATVGHLLARTGCPKLARLAAAVDTYRRAVLYALLTVPCFLQLQCYWLPALPGGALILSALFYSTKHCCGREAPYDFGKMPTFVRFEEDCCLAPELPVSHIATGQNIYQPSWQSETAEASPAGQFDAGEIPPALPPRARCQKKASGVAVRQKQQQQSDLRCLISEDSRLSQCD